MKHTAAMLSLVIGFAQMAGAQSPGVAPPAQAVQPQPTSQTVAPKKPDVTGPREVVYGSQLMTPAERAEYRSKMLSLETQEERDAFRAEHHKLIQTRANERGMTLRDMPPGRGMGR